MWLLKRAVGVARVGQTSKAARHTAKGGLFHPLGDEASRYISEASGMLEGWIELPSSHNPMVSRSRPLGNALSRKRPAVPSSRSYLTSRSHPLKNLLSDEVLILRGAKDLGVQID